MSGGCILPAAGECERSRCKSLEFSRCCCSPPALPSSIHDKVGGYTEAQRLFIAFAQIWHGSRTPQVAALMAKTDPHSPGKFRTDGSVQNFPAFGRAFRCKKGDPMMPVHYCRVW
jgi:predicted metalloendopeptidase